MNRQTHHLAVFDHPAASLGPLTDLRPACDIRTGMLTTLERIQRTCQTSTTCLRVDETLASLAAELHPDCLVNRGHDDDLPWRIVHGGASSPALIDAIKTLPMGQALLAENHTLLAAHLDADQARAWWQSPVDVLPAGVLPQPWTGPGVIDRPWRVLAQLEHTLTQDLLACELPFYQRIKPGVSVTGDHAIKVAPSAKLHPMVVLNAEKGPIVIDEQAVIGSFAVIAGPCYVGKETIVAAHTHLRASTSIGPSCVVGGEISASVIQGNTNKGHAGYLGNALVGQWVNLGADTNASNLKNTYGPIRMSLTRDGLAENTGLSKLGPVIGDFVRTAIGSRLMTGSCIHTGAMLAISSFAPKFVERFAFLTDQGHEAYDMDKFIQTVREMMSRRNIPLMPAMETRLRQLASQG